MTSDDAAAALAVICDLRRAVEEQAAIIRQLQARLADVAPPKPDDGVDHP